MEDRSLRKIWFCYCILLAAVLPFGCAGMTLKEKTQLKVGLHLEGSPEGASQSPDQFRGTGGTRFRFVMESDKDQFIYVVARGTSGDYSLLLPNAEWGIVNNEFDAKQRVELPTPESSKWITLDDSAGAEHIMVILAKERILGLENLYREQEPSKETFDQVITELEVTANRAKVTKEITDEFTVYSFSSDTQGVLKADVNLRHE